jgi:hypothetical protein
MKTIRLLLLIIIIGLFISGLTAIPIEAELSALLNMTAPDTGLYQWLSKVLAAYKTTAASYPFLIYGYDWLAFAHFLLAILFIGPYRDPVKNVWVIQFGMIACLLVFPLAFIAGPFRGIPMGWTLIDCSFGVFAFFPLFICHKKIKQLLIKQSTR